MKNYIVCYTYYEENGTTYGEIPHFDYGGPCKFEDGDTAIYEYAQGIIETSKETNNGETIHEPQKGEKNLKVTVYEPNQHDSDEEGIEIYYEDFEAIEVDANISKAEIDKIFEAYRKRHE